MLHGVQPRYAGKRNDRVRRRGFLHAFKELLLIRTGIHLRKQPVFMAESGNVVCISASLFVPRCQYDDSVHGVPPFEIVFFALVGFQVYVKSKIFQ